MGLRRRSFDPGAHLVDAPGECQWQAGGVRAIYPIQTESMFFAKLQCDIERNAVTSGNIVVPLHCTHVDCSRKCLLRLKIERDARDLKAFSYCLLSFGIRLHFNRISLCKPFDQPGQSALGQSGRGSYWRMPVTSEKPCGCECPRSPAAPVGSWVPVRARPSANASPFPGDVPIPQRDQIGPARQSCCRFPFPSKYSRHGYAWLSSDKRERHGGSCRHLFLVLVQRCGLSIATLTRILIRVI